MGGPSVLGSCDLLHFCPFKTCGLRASRSRTLAPRTCRNYGPSRKRENVRPPLGKANLGRLIDHSSIPNPDTWRRSADHCAWHSGKSVARYRAV